MSTYPGSIIQVSLDRAIAIVKRDVAKRPIRMNIWHHFYIPAARHYTGRNTMLAVWRYHVEYRKWRDTGYPWLLAPNGDIFTGRTMRWTGGHCIGHNHDSFGLGMCLNGDEENLSDFPKMERAALALSVAACETYKIVETDLFWHADFARKSCPGKLLDRAYYRERLRDLLTEDEGVRLKINDELVRDARLVNEGGSIVVKHQFTWYESSARPRLFREGEKARDVLEKLGLSVYWRGKHGPRGTIYSYGSPI